MYLSSGNGALHYTIRLIQSVSGWKRIVGSTTGITTPTANGTSRFHLSSRISYAHFQGQIDYSPGQSPAEPRRPAVSIPGAPNGHHRPGHRPTETIAQRRMACYSDHVIYFFIFSGVLSLVMVHSPCYSNTCWFTVLRLSAFASGSDPSELL
jgi:hypothetical protein